MTPQWLGRMAGQLHRRVWTSGDHAERLRRLTAPPRFVSNGAMAALNQDEIDGDGHDGQNSQGVVTVAEAQAVLDESPFGPWWGIRVERIGLGTATVLLAARAELYRPGGVLQGGCCMVLADVAFW